MQDVVSNCRDLELVHALHSFMCNQLAPQQQSSNIPLQHFQNVANNSNQQFQNVGNSSQQNFQNVNNNALQHFQHANNNKHNGQHSPQHQQQQTNGNRNCQPNNIFRPHNQQNVNQLPLNQQQYFPPNVVGQQNSNSVANQQQQQQQGILNLSNNNNGKFYNISQQQNVSQNQGILDLNDNSNKFPTLSQHDFNQQPGILDLNNSNKFQQQQTQQQYKPAILKIPTFIPVQQHFIRQQRHLQQQLQQQQQHFPLPSHNVCFNQFPPPPLYPYIKVAGLPEDRLAAKQMVLSVMDTKSTRVTLKMDVSFTDHSHIIGKGGNTIKKVMKDTQCHIHFPDSNRTSSEKSNQVSIAGPPFCVESARRQIRELLPIVLKFEIPSTALIPDSSSPVIVNIAQTHGVTVSFQQQLCGYGYIGSVRGLHSDPFSVRDAILKVLEHLTGRIPVTVPVTTQFEIDPKHHIYVIGRNGSNIKKITSVCGASIHFADPHDPTTRRSTVTVTGSIESAVNAKVYLLEYLPLILMFDIRDGENEARLEEGALRNLMDSLEVQIIMKPKPRQYCKSLIIKSHEKNASNVYRTRLHLIGEDPANMPFLLSPLATLVMPHPPIHPFHLLPPPLNGFAPPRHPLMNSQSNSPLSPPVQSSSPLIGQNNQRNDLIGQNNQRNTIGSEMKMKRLSFDALITKSSEGESEEIDGPRGNLSGAGLNDSWRNHPQSVMDPVHKGSNGSVDSGLSQSQEELNDNISMTNQMLKNLALHNESKVADDYELRKQMAKNAMHSQVTYGKARTPTDLWSGFGFSNSMPESVIKELWNNREKRMNAKPKLNEIQQSPDGSLNSSHSSHESGSSRVTSNNGVGSPVRRPPPGLEDSFPSRDNLLLLNNNRDFGFSMSGRTSPMNSVYANVKTLAELFEKIGLEQYSEAFVKEEVDLNTFMSLTDQDLKELGVNTFGARKKMQNAMRELQIYQNKQNSPIMPQQPSLSPAFYHHIDVAAHSLRW